MVKTCLPKFFYQINLYSYYHNNSYKTHSIIEFMKSFESFLETGEIKRIEPDIELAKLMLFDTKARLEIAAELELNEKNARVILELVNDAIIKMIEVILLSDGYKSSSYESTLSYLQKFQDFSDVEILELEKFRRIAHQSRYHAKPASLQEALEIRRVFPKTKEKLIKQIKVRLL